MEGGEPRGFFRAIDPTHAQTIPGAIIGTTPCTLTN